MPFKSQSKPSKKSAQVVENKICNSSIISLDKNENILLKILAKPGSKVNSITGISDDGIEVKISAPPVDGEANTELISYLSKLFGLRKSDLSLDKGSRSRNKTVIIMKDAGKSINDLNEIIKSNIDET